MIVPGTIDSTMIAQISWNAAALNSVAQTSALQIVDCLVEGTLIAIFAGLLSRMTRMQSAGTRFAVWFSALIAIAALPLFGGSLITHGWSASSGDSSAVSAPAITLPASWALYALGAWALIAAWFLLGVGRGLSHLQVLRRSAVPVDLSTLDSQISETLGRNSARPVTLCISDQVQVPTAIGFFKPLIVVPRWVMQELAPHELNQIVLHELAHLRRRDDWTNLAQKLVKALFFFHPAVWWIEKRVSLEREMACDDAVVAETASPRAYAECLAHLAEKTFIQRSVILAQAALGRIRQTSIRVAQILDKNRPTGAARNWKPAVSLVAIFAVASVWGISKAPRLVAFSDSGTDASSVATLTQSLHFVSQSSDVAFGSTLAPRPVKVSSVDNGKPPIVQTKWTMPANHRDLNVAAKVSERAAARPTRAPGAISMVRQAKATAGGFAVTETLLVVVEGRDNEFPDQPVYQIQMWRVTVLHPAVHPNRIPRKEI